MATLVDVIEYSHARAATHDVGAHEHLGALFAGGILLFWLVALLCYRLLSDDKHVSTESRACHGILLH